MPWAFVSVKRSTASPSAVRPNGVRATPDRRGPGRPGTSAAAPASTPTEIKTPAAARSFPLLRALVMFVTVSTEGKSVRGEMVI